MSIEHNKAAVIGHRRRFLALSIWKFIGWPTHEHARYLIERLEKLEAVDPADFWVSLESALDTLLAAEEAMEEAGE